MNSYLPKEPYWIFESIAEVQSTIASIATEDNRSSWMLRRKAIQVVPSGSNENEVQ